MVGRKRERAKRWALMRGLNVGAGGGCRGLGLGAGPRASELSQSIHPPAPSSFRQRIRAARSLSLAGGVADVFLGPRNS